MSALPSARLVSDSPTTAELIDAIREGALFGEGTRLEGTEGIEVMASVLEENAHPDYTTVMVAKVAPPTEYFGVAGFRQALTDWISPYEDFRMEIDEVITQDDALIFLVHQGGMTKHGGVEVETRSSPTMPTSIIYCSFRKVNHDGTTSKTECSE